MKIFATILLVLTSLMSIGQDSTRVRFFVKGGEKYFVKIDGQLQDQTNIFTVAKGTHSVEIWSFKHQTFVGKLETGELDSTNYFAELKAAPEYVAFVREKDNYRRRLFLTKTAPFLVTGASAIALPIAFVSRTQKHEELIQNKFYNDHGQIQNDILENIERQYAVRNVLFYTALAGTVLGTASIFWLRPKAKDLAPPIFKQQNPFTLEEMELSLNSLNQSPQLGLTFNF